MRNVRSFIVLLFIFPSCHGDFGAYWLHSPDGESRPWLLAEFQRGKQGFLPAGLRVLLVMQQPVLTQAGFVAFRLSAALIN